MSKYEEWVCGCCGECSVEDLVEDAIREYYIEERRELSFKQRESENKCHRHGIRLEDGTPIYECIGCDKQNCERIEE